MNLRPKSRIIPVCLLICIAMLANTSAWAQEKLTSSILWEVSSPGSATKSYILGTYQYVQGDFYDQYPKILAKVNEVERIMTEVWSADEADKPDGSLSRCGDSTLRSSLTSKKEVQTMEDLMKATEIGENWEYALMEKLKPVVSYLVLSTGLWLKTSEGVQYGSGLSSNLYFQDFANTNDLELEGLEPKEWVLNYLLTRPIPEQVEMLRAILKDSKASTQSIVDIVESYSKNDAKELEKLLNAKSNRFRVPQSVREIKNKKWAVQIATAVKEKSTFITVEAAHLYGDKGLVELLRKQGLTVTPIAIN